MSLLMQALKKAERAKQNSAHEDELEKPSEAFDEILSLSPQEPAAPVRPPQEPLSLTPLADAAPAAAPGRPLDFAAPEAVVAAAPAAPAAQPEPNPAPEAIHDFTARAPRHADTAHEGPRAKPEVHPKPRARAKPAPARAPMSVDPATLRLGGLVGVAALLLSAYGYWYWQATHAPGAGANLPMVPMPLTDEAGAASSASAPQPVTVTASPDPDQLIGSQIAGQGSGPGMSGGAGREEIFGRGPAQENLNRGSASDPYGQSNGAPAPVPFPPQAAAPLAAHAAQTARPAPSPNYAPAPVSLPPVVAADNGDIRVVRNDVEPQVNPALESAYKAFNAGDTAAARRQYDAVLRQDPNSRDALLGMAAIALRENDGQQAGGHYLRLLELDPNDGEAVAGLIGLRQGDPVQSESRLKAILQRAPEAGPVLFALGNLYAKQSRWSEAQQLFFRAYTTIPGNADYAFNLAVGLDRLNQGKLALGYYRRALALSQTTPGGFDRGALRKRLQELDAGAARQAPTTD